LHTWHYHSTLSTKPHLINTFCYTYTLSHTLTYPQRKRQKPKEKDTPIRRKIMVSSWRWFVRSKVWRKPNFVFNTTEKVGPNQTPVHKHHIFKTLVEPLKQGTWRLFSAFVPQLSLPADVSPKLTAFSHAPYLFINTNTFFSAYLVKNLILYWDIILYWNRLVLFQNQNQLFFFKLDKRYD